MENCIEENLRARIGMDQNLLTRRGKM